GKIYRIGDIKIEGNSILSEQYIQNVIGLNKGDIANGERIGKAIYEDLKRVYGTQGFLQYEAELEPSFRDNPQNPNEGIADFTIKITEG
ncbi:POTRA domain-containing protein, partial [Acinetobacter baumannii]